AVDTSRPPATERPSSFAALRHRDFRLLWAGQFVSITGSQMQLVTINWHVYILTHSAFALGLVGLVRVVPIILCSLLGGVVADAVDRKRLIVVTQTVVLARYGPAMVYAINAASFLAVIAAMLMIRAGGRAKGEESGRVSFEALAEGLKFVWHTPIMVQTMALDFVATFFASANALLPIFASRILNVDEYGYGFLAAASAFGAVLTGLFLTRRPGWGR